MTKSPHPKKTSGPAQSPENTRWSPSIWISLSSAAIALCALMFTVQQGCLQREYWRLTAQPHMTVSFFYNDEGAGFMFGGTGIGHAILKTFEVFVDGKPQSNWTEMCRTLGFASKPTFEFVVPRPEAVFNPDSYNKTFWIPSGPQAEELKLKTSRVLIRACYCSIYPECWQVDSRGSFDRLRSCPAPEVTFSAPPRTVTLP